MTAAAGVVFRAMGTEIRATIDSDASGPRARLSRVPGWFAAWERRLSRFARDGREGELARMNRLPGAHVRVSPTLAGALDAALAAARWTDGIVTPTLLEALERAGYDRDFDALAGRADAATSSAHPACRDHRELALDGASRVFSRPQGARLDLGGTAKGWSADRAARHLGKLAPALVDAGGDVSVSGPQRDGGPWLVSVANPASPGEPLALLAIDRGGVATSGRDRRRWLKGGVWQHHVIDPRTLEPAQTDVLSATVIASSALLAEVAAKVVLVRGHHEGLAWLGGQPGLEGLVVDDAGRATVTRGLDRYLVA